MSTNRRNRLHIALMLALGLSVVPLAAHAADTDSGPVEPPVTVTPPLSLGGASTVAPPSTAAVSVGTPTVASFLSDGRAAIAAKKWTDAITALKKAEVLDPKNADVQNLLGFSSRNNGDYAAALAHYAAALKINPKHAGALQYQGVAFMLVGQTAKARANLATLKRVCGTTYPEYKDLAAALKSPKSKKKY